MAKAGRVQNWKHGWIPVSPAAKAFAAGRGPRPVSGKARSALPKKGDPDYSPNNEFGMPSKKIDPQAQRPAAEGRAKDIQELLPMVNPQPHWQFASQDTPGHYTGGVVLSPQDTDAALYELSKNREGEAGVLSDSMAGGRVSGRARFLTTNTAKGNPEEQAKRRARRLAQRLDLKNPPQPYYQKVDGSNTLGGRSAAPTTGYTGGLVFLPTQADEFIAQLNRKGNLGGELTAWRTRTIAGNRSTA